MAREGMAASHTTDAALKQSASAGQLNNGYQEDEMKELSSPVTAGRLPPLELEVPKRHKHKHKSKSPRVPHLTLNEGQSEVTLTIDESLSVKQHRKKRHKSRPASAEDRPEGSASNNESTPSSRIELPESGQPIESKGAQIEVEADIECPPDNLLTPDPNRHVSRSLSSNSARKHKRSNDQRSEVPQDMLSVQSTYLEARSVPSLPASRRSEEIETVDLVSMDVTNAAAVYSKGPSHSILKHSSESDDHVVDMFRAGSRPNSASSSKPSVRIDDNVTYADEVFKPTRPKSASSNRPKSASSNRPKSANGHRPKSANSHRPASASSHRPEAANGSFANGTGSEKANKLAHWKLNQTTQRKISPHVKTSIFTMIFCGLFAGGAALYFSLKSRRALKKGDQVEAAKNSWYSKLFNIIGISTGLFITIVVVIYYNVQKHPASEA